MFKAGDQDRSICSAQTEENARRKDLVDNAMLWVIKKETIHFIYFFCHKLNDILQL